MSIVQMDLSHVPFGPPHALGRTELGLIFLEAVRSVTTWVPGYRVDVAAILKRKGGGREVIADVDDEAPSQFRVGERAGPSVPRTHSRFFAHRSMAQAHGRRARGSRQSARCPLVAVRSRCRSRACQSWAVWTIALGSFESAKNSPLLIRAVVKVDSAIGAAAQAVRPRISRVPRAPWLLSRAPSIRPRSTVALAAFWVRIQPASGFNA